MKVELFDTVLLKDGRIASVVEVYGDDSVDVDVGSSPEDWETLWGVPISDIEKVLDD